MLAQENLVFIYKMRKSYWYAVICFFSFLPIVSTSFLQDKDDCKLKWAINDHFYGLVIKPYTDK